MRLYLMLVFLGFLVRDQPEERIARDALRRYFQAFISPPLFWNGLVIILAFLASLFSSLPFLECWFLFFLSLHSVLATVWFAGYYSHQNGKLAGEDWQRTRALTVDVALSRESLPIAESMGLSHIPVVIDENVRGYAAVYCKGQASRIVVCHRFLRRLPPSARPGLFAHELAHLLLRHSLVRYCLPYANLSSLIAFPLTECTERSVADYIAGLTQEKPAFQWRAKVVHLTGPAGRFFQHLSFQHLNRTEEFAADAVAALVVGRQSVRELLEHTVQVEGDDGAWDNALWQKNHPPLCWRIRALTTEELADTP